MKPAPVLYARLPLGVKSFLPLYVRHHQTRVQVGVRTAVTEHRLVDELKTEKGCVLLVFLFFCLFTYY